MLSSSSGDHPTRGGGDLQHLAGHGALEAVDAGDAVLDLEHLADLLGLECVAVALDLTEQHVLDLAGPQRGIRRHLVLFLSGPEPGLASAVLRKTVS
jgi:hypothetical protein